MTRTPSVTKPLLCLRHSLGAVNGSQIVVVV